VIGALAFYFFFHSGLGLTYSAVFCGFLHGVVTDWPVRGWGWSGVTVVVIFPEHGVLIGLRFSFTVRTLVVACGSLPWDDSMIGGSLGRPARHNGFWEYGLFLYIAWERAI